MTIRFSARDEVATIVSDSDTAAAATCTSALPAAAGYRTVIKGFTITGLGATGATTVEATLAGLGTTLKFSIAVPAGVTTGITPLSVPFGDGMPASADNTAITLSVPTFGSGNTKVCTAIWGFQVPTS